MEENKGRLPKVLSTSEIIVMARTLSFEEVEGEFEMEVNAMPKSLVDAALSASTLEKRNAILEELWEVFGDIPMDPSTECIEAPFLHWPAGTHRETIWHEFDKLYSKGVVYLLYGIDYTKGGKNTALRVCNECNAAECVYNHAGDCRFFLTHDRRPGIGSDYKNWCAEFQPNTQAKFVKAYNIDWDLEEGDSAEDLPAEIIIPQGIPEDEVDNYISNVSGFCFYGYETTEPKTLAEHSKDSEPVNILVAAVDAALSVHDNDSIDLVIDEESGYFVVMYHSENNSFNVSDYLLDASMVSDKDKEKLVAELNARHVGHCW